MLLFLKKIRCAVILNYTNIDYCFLNKVTRYELTPEKAFENYKYHDPDSPLLLGHVKKTDIVQQGVQKSFLKKEQPDGQIALDL